MLRARCTRSFIALWLLASACTDDVSPSADETGGELEDPTCLDDASPDADPPVEGEPVCATQVGAHANAQCSSGPCPITNDVILACDREFTQLGLRVAAFDDEANLLSSSDERAMLLSSGSSGATFESLPIASLRQTALLARDGAGGLYAALAVRQVEGGSEDGVILLRRDPSEWTPISISVSEPGAPSLLFDLESVGNEVQYWHDGGLDWPQHSSYAISNAQAFSGSTYPITPGSWTHWTIGHDGAIVSLSFAKQGGVWQLGARRPDPDGVEVLGIDSTIGDPVATCEPLGYRPIPPTVLDVPAATLPSYAVVIQQLDGLHIAWPSDAQQYLELTVPGTALAGPECTSPAPSGLAMDGFAAAQTADGRLWLAWVEVRPCDELDTLRLASFEFENGTLTEQLELDIDPLAPIVRTVEPANARAIDVRAWGSRLAIGLRTRGGEQPASARLIQLDTSTL
ncbi:MAG TPA: hypothetical protein VM869_18525 [Enhygromyxa sp.]|nr:hypothetical protein [Enhygromyxa sp.]